MTDVKPQPGHYCPDWDELFVVPDSAELSCCTCEMLCSIHACPLMATRPHTWHCCVCEGCEVWCKP